jgi:hypothetical protein
MSDTLVLQTAPERIGQRRDVLIRAVGIGGLLLTTGTAVAAAYAGVTQRVTLPDWWGPWPWRQPGAMDWFVVLGLFLLGGFCALWAWLVATVSRDPAAGGPLSTIGVRIVAAMAAAWSLPMVLGGPIGSLDVNSYAAIGRLAALGFDPYRATTGLLGDNYSEAVDPLWRWTPTPYGPLQVQLLRGVLMVAGTHPGLAVLLIRGVAMAALAGALVLTLRAVAPSERVPVLAVTALSPVVLVHVVSGAHLDVLVGLLALAVIGFSHKRHHGLAMAFAVVACAVKLPGAVLVAFVLLDALRRVPVQDRARALFPALGSGMVVLAAIVALCPHPFGWVPALGVPGIVHNGAAPSTWAAYVAALLTGQLSGPGLDFAFTVGRMATGILGAGAVVALLWGATSGSPRQAFRGVGWALVVLAMTGPALYPWYLTWGLFAAAVGSGPRGRVALVGLSSATCLAAALGQGWMVFAAWLIVLLGVLAYTGWVSRAHLLGAAGPASAVPSIDDPALTERANRHDVPAL